MRGKTTRLQDQSNDVEYLYPNIAEKKYSVKSRLDLNDLLKRMQDEKKVDKKTNILILTGAASFAAVLLLIISYY